MRRILLSALALMAAASTTSVCSARWVVSNTGNWPKSWPVELESLRSQSRTLHNPSQTRYQIPFTDRAHFEAMWPHFLSMATEDSPLILLRNDDKGSVSGIHAGVVIDTPNTGERLTFDDKKITVHSPGSESSVPGAKSLTVGPPWPDAIRDQAGRLPEYVVPDALGWRATTSQEMSDDLVTAIRARRARTEIRLIVDGNVVDLNEIKLPTWVIDKRFEKPPSP